MTKALVPARASAALALLALLAARPAQAQTGITIYNDGRVLVRRTVSATVPRGASEQRIPLGPLDPGSLFSLDSAVTIYNTRYDAAVDEGSVLRRAVGRRIGLHLPRAGGGFDTTSALVLGVDPLRLQLPDGRVTFNLPGMAVYPAELVVTEPAALIGLRSAEARNQLRLGYFTDGAGWQASYQVILAAGTGGGTARVTGKAVIPSQTLKVDDAEIQLLAGAVGRAMPEQAKYGYRAMREMVAAAPAPMMQDASAAGEQRVGQFHLYSLPGRWSLMPGLTTSIALFEPAGVRYERSLVVRGELPWWGPIYQRPEDEQRAPVEINYLLTRARKTEFGDRPLPGGVARVYQPDSAGRLQLVGEASLDHTAAGQDLRLKAGEAFDLTAKRVQTNFVTRRDSTRAGWRTIATVDYAVTVANAGDSTAAVEVLEERAGEWTVVSSSVPAEKVSSTVTRFRLTVPAQGETRVTYRLRVVW